MLVFFILKIVLKFYEHYLLAYLIRYEVIFANALAISESLKFIPDFFLICKRSVRTTSGDFTALRILSSVNASKRFQ